MTQQLLCGNEFAKSMYKGKKDSGILFSFRIFFFNQFLHQRRQGRNQQVHFLAGFGAAIINSRFVVPKTNVMSHFVLNLFKHYVAN